MKENKWAAMTVWAKMRVERYWTAEIGFGFLIQGFGFKIKRFEYF
jgi:hypothetical protein